MSNSEKKEIVPMTLDGLPIRHTISFLSDDKSLNQWSAGKTIRVPVLADGFKPGWVVWRGRKRYEFDIPFFYGMIRDWVRGCTETEATMPGLIRGKGMTKEEALDLSFEISPGEPV